jgi:short-subunit dehydrogenase
MADKGLDLRGSVAVVTGAASGIGAALAHVLSARGCALALADRDAAGLATAASAARACGVTVSEHVLDVADADAVAALPAAVLAAHGRVNVLVNNAGVALVGRFDQVSMADFEWLFNINFWGTVRMTRAFLPLLRQEKAAQLVNLSSVYGLIAPPGETAYAASKFAVRGFTEALRHELEASSVGVTVVHPGGIRTAVAKNARKAEALTAADVAAGMAMFDKLTRTEPETAAEVIAQGIERREPRVLIGKDAKQIATLVRLFPVSYWPRIQKSIARTIRRASAGDAVSKALPKTTHG